MSILSAAGPTTEFFVGLDLGQIRDYSALVVVEHPLGDVPQGSGVWQRFGRPAVYHARHVERIPLGTPYPEIVRRTMELMAQPQLRPRPIDPSPQLAVDATGVGVAVIDMLREAGLVFTPIVITGGDHITRSDGALRIPKRDLVANAQVLLQQRRLRFASRMAHVGELTRELLDFRVKIDAKTAHDSYGAWRDGEHDDLVLALCLAMWIAEGGRGSRWWDEDGEE